jgi:hypothetical protein
MLWRMNGWQLVGLRLIQLGGLLLAILMLRRYNRRNGRADSGWFSHDPWSRAEILLICVVVVALAAVAVAWNPWLGLGLIIALMIPMSLVARRRRTHDHGSR